MRVARRTQKVNQSFVKRYKSEGLCVGILIYGNDRWTYQIEFVTLRLRNRIEDF